MAQYTFSYKNSEYDRIPIELAEKTESILAKSKAPEETIATLRELMAAVHESVAELALYAQDELKL